MQHFCFYQFNAQLTLSRRWRRCWQCLLLVGFVVFLLELLARSLSLPSITYWCRFLRTSARGYWNCLQHFTPSPHPLLPTGGRKGVAGGRLSIYIYFFYWLFNFVTCQYRPERKREREGTFVAAHLNFNLYCEAALCLNSPVLSLAMAKSFSNWQRRKLLRNSHYISKRCQLTVCLGPWILHWVRESLAPETVRWGN